MDVLFFQKFAAPFRVSDHENNNCKYSNCSKHLNKSHPDRAPLFWCLMNSGITDRSAARKRG